MATQNVTQHVVENKIYFSLSALESDNFSKALINKLLFPLFLRSKYHLKALNNSKGSITGIDSQNHFFPISFTEQGRF